VGGKRWAIMFLCICISSAHSSAAELLTPRSIQEMQGNLEMQGNIVQSNQEMQRATLNMCRHVKVGVWGCVRKKMCAVPCSHSVFPIIPFTHCINFDSSGTRKIKLTNARVGNSTLAAKLCLGDPTWPPSPKEGVTQW